jgi:hypothetical protein
MVEMTHLAIDVGCEQGRVIELYIKEYLPMWMGDFKVVRLDIDPKSKPDILHDIREPFPKDMLGKYEYVHCTHVLEHMPWHQAVSVFKYYMIAVPSLEFACREIIRGNCNQGIMGMIYGGQDDEFAFHNSGFTRPALEMMTQQIGFNTYSFKETDIIVFVDGKQFRGKQHELMLRNLPEPVVITEEAQPAEELKTVELTKRTPRKRSKRSSKNATHL